MKIWTDAEVDILRREYKGTNKSAERIASKLNTTRHSVKYQVQKHGLAISKTKWTDKELERLEELVHIYPVTKIAKIMNRSQNAVKVKATRLKLNLRARDDWFTKREIAEICGVDHHKVQKWIDSGALKASWHGDLKPQKNGCAMWHIELSDLKNFLVKYSGELVGRNTDIQTIIWIVKEG